MSNCSTNDNASDVIFNWVMNSLPETLFPQNIYFVLLSNGNVNTYMTDSNGESHLISSGGNIIHNNLEGLNQGDFLHLTQSEYNAFVALIEGGMGEFPNLNQVLLQGNTSTEPILLAQGTAIVEYKGDGQSFDKGGFTTATNYQDPTANTTWTIKANSAGQYFFASESYVQEAVDELTHNGFPDLQGGAPNEYFHFTEAEHASLVSFVNAGGTDGLDGTLAQGNTSDLSIILGDETSSVTYSKIGQIYKDNGSNKMIDIGYAVPTVNVKYTIPAKEQNDTFAMLSDLSGVGNQNIDEVLATGNTATDKEVVLNGGGGTLTTTLAPYGLYTASTEVGNEMSVIVGPAGVDFYSNADQTKRVSLQVDPDLEEFIYPAVTLPTESGKLARIEDITDQTFQQVTSNGNNTTTNTIFVATNDGVQYTRIGNDGLFTTDGNSSSAMSATSIVTTNPLTGTQASFNASGVLSLQSGAYNGSVETDLLTASREYQLPNNSGTLALLSDIPTQTIDEVPTDGSENAVSSNGTYDAIEAAKAYADGLVTSVFRAAGNWDASVGTFPTTGTGSGGAIRRGDTYIVSVAGTMGGKLYDVGDSFYANVAAPAQTAANWSKFEANTEQATSALRGTVKLYTTTGTNTDGGVDQNTLSTQLDLKAPLASPALTGTPTAPTATPGTNTTQLATTAFVTTGLATKQATLVSGTNIKTVNGNSLLGSGDLVIGGGTVTNVSGTTNQIDVVNPTTTPVLSISATYTAARDAVANGKVTQTITNGVTTTAPSEDAVFDALALKQNAFGGTTGYVYYNNVSGVTTFVGNGSSTNLLLGDGTATTAAPYIRAISVGTATTAVTQIATNTGIANGIWQLQNQINAMKIGTSTQSGNGTSTSFTIPHTLGAVPTYANAVPKTAAAGNISYQTWDATNITVFYSVAPVAGTNNLNWAFTAR